MEESNKKNISVARLRPETRMVVLDLDGTLYEKPRMPLYMVLGDLLEAPLLLKERRVRKAMRGQWFGSAEAFEKAFFDNMVKGRLCTVSFVRWWYTTCYMPLMVEVVEKHYKPCSWVQPFVEECRKMGVIVVVLSDYTHAKEKIQALGLDVKMFDWVVSAPELGGLKPARELMQVVAERMGVPSGQSVVIGDRDDTDGALARATGATFWQV